MTNNPFKILIAVIKNTRQKDTKTMLGRWNTVHTRSSLNTKIDLSNEDHCGPCGQYILEKNIDSYMKNHVKKN